MATYNPWQQANRRRQNTPDAPGQYNYDWLEDGDGTAPPPGLGTGDYIPINSPPGGAASDYPIDFPINHFTPTPPPVQPNAAYGNLSDISAKDLLIRRQNSAIQQLLEIETALQNPALDVYDKTELYKQRGLLNTELDKIGDDLRQMNTPAKPTSPWRMTGFDPKIGQAVQINQDTGDIRSVRLEDWTPPPVSDGSGPAWGQLAQRQAEFDWEKNIKYPEEQAYKKWAAEEQARNTREQQRMKDEADMRRQQLATTGQWAAAMGNQYMDAIPMAAIPGQTHFLGFEPGGIFETIAKKSGRAYDPDKFRAPIYQYDPNEMWRRAQSNVGGQ